MNRRGLRVREVYGFGLIAGIPVENASRMSPGFVLDMYAIRAKYDARLAAPGLMKKAGM